MRLRYLILGLVTLSTPSAFSQTQRSGGEAQKFMQQYQQLSAEKTALQAQLAQMKTDLDAGAAELARAKKERDVAKTHVGISPATLTEAVRARENAENALEQSKQRTAEIVGKYRELAQTLKDTENDRGRLSKEVIEHGSALDKCARDNAELASLSEEVLTRYEHVGLFSRTSAAEPFTRLTRTRIENTVDEYRARANGVTINKPRP
jgi:chromosome segregation ATPase